MEGTGDHGCEYMTGGVAVVLGKTGRNFAAGMSGGVAYVWNPDGDFARNFNDNHGLTLLEPIRDAQDEAQLKFLLENHVRHTQSERAAPLLANWATALLQFVKVVSLEYRRVLQEAQAEARTEAKRELVAA